MSTLLLAIAILVLSLAAGFAPRLFAARLTDDRLHDLTGLASGLLIASAMLVVIPEGFDVAAAGEDGFTDEPLRLGAALLVGFVVMAVLEGLGVGHAVHEEHHDHVAGHGHGHVHHPSNTAVLAVGLSVHAAADGLAIGSAAAAGETAFTALVALAVVLHRIPTAFSLGLFTLHETTDRRASVGIMAFAVSTPVTMLVASALLDAANDRLVALALLFSAGTFLYVATVDTLPAVHNPETGRRSVAMVMAGALAFTVLLVVLDVAGATDHGH